MAAVPTWRKPSRGTGASCTCTATACSRRTTRPRTPCRRPTCAPGVPATTSTGDNVRAWLYRIATHVCLDRARARQRRVARRHRGQLAHAVPRPAARRGGTAEAGARPGLRGAGDDRAGVPHRPAGAAGAAAGGAAGARGARPPCGRHRAAARHHRGRHQQRAAARPRDDARAPAVAPQRVDRRRAEPGREAAARRLHRRPRAVRRRGRAGRRRLRHAGHDAALPLAVRRSGRAPPAARARLRARTARATGGCCRPG